MADSPPVECAFGRDFDNLVREYIEWKNSRSRKSTPSSGGFFCNLIFGLASISYSPLPFPESELDPIERRRDLSRKQKNKVLEGAIALLHGSSGFDDVSLRKIREEVRERATSGPSESLESHFENVQIANLAHDSFVKIRVATRRAYSISVYNSAREEFIGLAKRN